MYFYRNNKTRNRLIQRVFLIRLGLLELALAPASPRAFSQHQHTQCPLPGRHLSGFRSGRTTLQAPRPATLHGLSASASSLLASLHPISQHPSVSTGGQEPGDFCCALSGKSLSVSCLRRSALVQHRTFQLFDEGHSLLCSL